MLILHAAVYALLAAFPAPVIDAVARYNAALEDVQAKKKGASVQRVFEAALAARAAVVASSDSSPLPAEDLAALAESMPALRVEPTGQADLNPEFFQTLAQKHGSTADAEFFRIYRTGGSGACTRFGEGEVLNRYKGLFVFSRKHNPAYRAHVIEQIEEVEREITSARCACDDAATVRAALADIAREFPLGKITPRVRQRIQEIDRGTSDFRFECSGR